MTTPTLDELIADEQDFYDGLVANDCREDAIAFSAAKLASLQRLARYEAVKVPEPVAWYDLDLDVDFGANRPSVPGTWKPLYGPEVIDLLRRETVAKEKSALWFIGEQQRRRAEKAEATLVKMGRLATPSDAMRDQLKIAEAERDALQDRLNSMESLYVSTIAREPLP